MHFHTNDYYAYVNVHLTDRPIWRGYEVHECLLVVIRRTIEPSKAEHDSATDYK